MSRTAQSELDASSPSDDEGGSPCPHSEIMNHAERRVIQLHGHRQSHTTPIQQHGESQATPLEPLLLPPSAQSLAAALGCEVLSFVKGLLLARVKDLEAIDEKIESVRDQVIDLIQLHDHIQGDSCNQFGESFSRAGQCLRGKMVGIVDMSSVILDDLQEDLQDTLDCAEKSTTTAVPTGHDWSLQRYLVRICEIFLELEKSKQS